MTTRAEYITKMKHQLDELNVRMNHLDAKAEEVKDDVRAKYKEEMAALRHQSKLASAKLESLVAASEAGWESMIDEMETIRDAFTHSFNYFKSQV